ncbi:cell death abnormality protein 1 [Biomphalaria glabrata]|nr:Biomphalaria glabrata cell death abnormality protein 1-like [Biomphalaria glabrata]
MPKREQAYWEEATELAGDTGADRLMMSTFTSMVMAFHFIAASFSLGSEWVRLTIGSHNEGSYGMQETSFPLVTVQCTVLDYTTV